VSYLRKQNWISDRNVFNSSTAKMHFQRQDFYQQILATR